MRTQTYRTKRKHELNTEFTPYYYRARYYDPAVGRFLSEDPAAFYGGINVYDYVGNAPTNFNDPFGLAECVYSISQHTLTCTESRIPPVGPRWQLQLGPEGVHSGDPGPCQDKPACENNVNHGPIHEGRYKMNPDERPEHKDWALYRLEPTSWSKWNSLMYYLSKVGIGNQRGGFELHIGSITHGCINADKTDPRPVDQYHTMQRMLQGEDGTNYLTVVP